jgi:hypothetical protein
MRQRCPAAAVQLAVFVGGGVAAPVWHLASHRPDHTHGPDGWAFTFHVHEAAADHDHDHPHPDDARSLDRLPLDHGHGSLAHFGLALLGSPPAVAVPEPEPVRDVLVTPRPATLRLFQPSFPLSRPPPSFA